jgi:hypothetical protein
LEIHRSVGGSLRLEDPIEHVVLDGTPEMNADLGACHAERSEASRHFSWREEETAGILHFTSLRSE